MSERKSSDYDLLGEQFEDEIDSSSVSASFLVPGWVQGLVTLGSVCIVGFCIYCYFSYLRSHEGFPSPGDLGLGGLLAFAVAAAGVVLTPWSALGLRVTKIGGIEFKDVVRGQAKEHFEDLNYLHNRIEKLENSIRKLDDTAAVTEHFEEDKLSELLGDFLKAYRKYSFSPSRVSAWGSRQKGFGDLSKYDVPFIRNTLQKMVSNGEAETRISRKGNTLYRVAAKS